MSTLVAEHATSDVADAAATTAEVATPAAESKYGVDPAVLMQRIASLNLAARAPAFTNPEASTTDKILGALQMNGGGLTVKELVQATGLRRTTIQSALEGLLADEKVRGGGRRQKWQIWE